MRFTIRKGSADPFRGDWYIRGAEFNSAEKAIAAALALTLENYLELGSSWEEYGYEWSVFKETAREEKKIWEGYKAIQVMKTAKKVLPEAADGMMEEE